MAGRGAGAVVRRVQRARRRLQTRAHRREGVLILRRAQRRLRRGARIQRRRGPVVRRGTRGVGGRRPVRGDDDRARRPTVLLRAPEAIQRRRRGRREWWRGRWDRRSQRIRDRTRSPYRRRRAQTTDEPVLLQDRGVVDVRAVSHEEDPAVPPGGQEGDERVQPRGVPRGRDGIDCGIETER